LGGFPGPRSFLIVSMLAIVALVAAGAMGYDATRRSDEQALALQRRLLQSSIAQVGKADPLDYRTVPLIVDMARLPGLSFDTGPAPDGREQQALVDKEGRIAGIFTWDAPHSYRLLQPIGFVLSVSFAALFLLAALAIWQLRRAGQKLSETEAKAAHAAEADKLTGLPNHDRMLDILERALAERADREVIAFALLDIDGLDDAQVGSLGTDALIVTAAQRLHQALPEHAVCGRLAATEFGIVFGVPSNEDAQPVIRAALDALAQPYWADKVVRLTAQAGIALAPQHATTRAELSRRAELALRSAGKRGPGTLAVFDPSIDQASSEQKIIQRELPRALAAQELELHFQPIVSAAGGTINGCEALLRWPHAVRGWIPPATFIPVAEQMGLMDQLGSYVLRRALQEAKRWPDIYMSVNLSPLQVRHSGVVEMVRDALAEAGVPPQILILEITEGVLIDNPNEMVRRIADLHGLGVRLALDDFGAGYSNLGYLQRFPLDKLKIDKSFVDAIGTTENGSVILQAIAGLGRALGLSVTAEGVETENQRVLLRLAGCDEMQGYLFSKPMPARDFDRLLKRSVQGKSAALTA
jgi:diguanylate cyclase (GGDEF)-like protein